MRRKFVDVLPLDEAAIEIVGVAWCNKMFVLEREMAELASEERAIKRQEQMKPALDGFFAWVDTAGGRKLAKALQYAKNEKKYLYTFLDHPDAPIDNNCAENAILPFCIGRRNWLFSTSTKGAEASAIIYSVAATACANGLNVEDYLTNVFHVFSKNIPMPR